MTTFATSAATLSRTSDAAASPLVSVVIIFFNAERFLTEAIESVLAQTYDAWELVLVNDGSTDGSAAIAREFADADPERVRVVTHAGGENRGMSASRNRGVEAADGDLLAFLDADDVWTPDKLAEQVEILEDHPHADMVFGPAMYWYGWTGNTADAARDFVQSMGQDAAGLVQGPVLLERFLQREGTTPSPSGVMLRRDLWRRTGGFETSFRTLYEDQAFYAKTCLAGSVYVADRTWYRYRQHDNGACAVAAARDETSAARITFLDWLDGYLNEKADAPTTVRNFVHASLEPHRRPIRHKLRNAIAAGRQLLGRAMRASKRWLATDTPPQSNRSHIDWGDLRRVTPMARDYGASRGRCVDRHYIERFLAEHAGDVLGRVLEIGNDTYTRRFGGTRVSHRDIWHATPDNAKATLTGDLAAPGVGPDDAFDCIILTQTLHVMYDVETAVCNAWRMLRPGGVLLVTLPGISQVSRYDMDRWGDCWRFTTDSANRLFDKCFTGEVRIDAFGNVLAATALLQGISADDLTAAELDHVDADYPVTIAVRARKGGGRC